MLLPKTVSSGTARRTGGWATGDEQQQPYQAEARWWEATPADYARALEWQLTSCPRRRCPCQPVPGIWCHKEPCFLLSYSACLGHCLPAQHLRVTWPHDLQACAQATEAALELAMWVLQDILGGASQPPTPTPQD